MRLRIAIGMLVSAMFAGCSLIVGGDSIAALVPEKRTVDQVDGGQKDADGGVCEPDVACVPPAQPCNQGVTVCTNNVATCNATAVTKPNGSACGVAGGAKVCYSGACVNCGDACTPINPPADPCIIATAGTVACIGTSTICKPNTVADATPCGGGSKYCFRGQCKDCATQCDPCLKGMIDCATGACTDPSAQADGYSCGTLYPQVCNGGACMLGPYSLTPAKTGPNPRVCEQMQNGSDFTVTVKDTFGRPVNKAQLYFGTLPDGVYVSNFSYTETDTNGVARYNGVTHGIRAGRASKDYPLPITGGGGGTNLMLHADAPADKTVLTVVNVSGQLGNDYYSAPATSAKIGTPYGVAEDALGNLYFSDPNGSAIRKVTPDGLFSTIAGGTGNTIYDGTQEGWPGTSVNLYLPRSLAYYENPGRHWIIFADMGHERLRYIDLDTTYGNVHDLAGGYPFDCGGTSCPVFNAKLGAVSEISVVGDRLYVGSPETSKLRTINLSAAFPISGWTIDDLYINNPGCGVGVPVAPYYLCGPSESCRVTPAPGAELYIAGQLCGDDVGGAIAYGIVKYNNTGAITHIAGKSGGNAVGDNIPATSAMFNYPVRIFSGPGGFIYITTVNDHRIRYIDGSGMIQTLAGSTGGGQFLGDYAPITGNPSAANFNYPASLLTVGSSLFVADFNNSRVRVIW